MFPSKILGAMLGALLAFTPVWADGFSFKNGRLSQEKVIVLNLNPRQIRLLRKTFQPGVWLELTVGQQRFIKKHAKVKEAPTKILLFKPSNLEGDCSCGLFNVGLWFRPDQVELPISYICSDREAEDGVID